MATPVPYTGQMEVSPQLDPTSNVHVDTPVAAFGGDTAQAISHMGEVTQGVGKELFDRAYAMQDLHEQVKADQQSGDTFEKQIQRHLEFADLPAAQRTPEALSKYIQDITKIRNDGAEGLSPIGQARYLGDSRRMQSMLMLHAGELSKQGLRASSQAALTNSIEARGDALAVLDPKIGDANWDDSIAKIRSDAAHSVFMDSNKGFAPGTPENNAEVDKILSKQVQKVALARSQAHAEDGMAFFKRMSSGDHPLLLPNDAVAIEGVIESRVNNKTAADIAKKVVPAAGPNAKAGEVDRLAREAAEKADPGNSILAENAALRSIGLKNSIERNRFADEKQDRDAVMNMVNGVNSPNGKVPTSQEEASKMNPGDPSKGIPSFDKSFYRLGPDSKNAVLNRINHNAEIGGVEHNPRGDLVYAKMTNIWAGRDQTSTPQELRDMAEADLWKEPYTLLTRDQQINAIKMQHDIIHNVVQNPNLEHALNLPSVQQLLKDAQIDTTRTNGEFSDEYVKFRQHYHDAIVGYGLGAERTIKNDEELTSIATKLINTAKPGWFSKPKQPFDSFIDYSLGARAVGRTAFRKQFGREPDLDSPTDKKLTEDFAMRQIFAGYGRTSKPPADKNTPGGNQ